MSKGSGIFIDVRVGDSVDLDVPAGVDSARITITLDSKDGRKGRLRIKANDNVRIVRPEKRDLIPQT